VARGCSVDAERGIPFLAFDPAAQEFFDEWRIKLEQRLRSGQDSSLITCHLAKYRSLMPSLALVFHLIDSHAQTALEPVSLRAARDAAAWCVLLEAHARRIYQSAMDGDLDAAVHLGERIKTSLPNPFTYRTVFHKGWSGLTTAEEVRQAVGILQDRGWVKTVEVPSSNTKGGRPAELVWIHPKLSKPQVPGTFQVDQGHTSPTVRGYDRIPGHVVGPSKTSKTGFGGFGGAGAW
jgi:hypothetical protein